MESSPAAAFSTTILLSWSVVGHFAAHITAGRGPSGLCHRLVLRFLFFTSPSWGEWSRMWCFAWVALYSA